MSNKLDDVLESAIDTCGLRAVLIAIAYICDEKAEHLRVNWQDGTLAKAWERDATLVRALAAKVTK